jgi:hypothetical protein
VYLTVYKTHSLRLQQLHPVDEGELTGIARPAEHTLPEKYIPHAYAIQATHHMVILPSFCTVCEPYLVQVGIGGNNIVGYPGAILSWAVYGHTVLYHLIECGIGPELELATGKNLLHALAYF